MRPTQGLKPSIRRGGGRSALVWLIACVPFSLVVLLYPFYVIRPFRYQGQRELSVALGLMQVRPLLEVVFVVIALLLLRLVWRRNRAATPRVAAAACALLLIIFGVLSRVNIYEIMFHPLDRPSFSTASQARLGGEEEVIAIRVNGAARAYPVRSMSYHHIVNDVVEGVPIVATY